MYNYFIVKERNFHKFNLIATITGTVQVERGRLRNSSIVQCMSCIGVVMCGY